MQISAMIAGYENYAITVMIEPHRRFAKLLDSIEKQLTEEEMHYEFTAAYWIMYTCHDGLTTLDPAYIALGKGDPATVAKYLKLATRLDPTKTVSDYFKGETVKPDAVSMIVTWPSEVLSYEKSGRERAAAASLAEWLEQRNKPVPEETMERLQEIAAEDNKGKSKVPSMWLWQWFAHCFPWLTCKTGGANDKKND